MKKIIFSVLALGLSMGVMAQKVMVSDVELNGNEKLMVNRGETVGASKTSGTFYPQAFQSCATLDNFAYYTFDPDGTGTYVLPVTGSGAFGGCGQTYTFSSPVTITGVEMYMSNIYPGDDATPDVVIMNGDFTEEIAATTYNTADLAVSETEITVAPVTATFGTPVTNQTSFGIAVYYPVYGQTSTDVLVVSTEVGCSSGLNVRLLYNGEWTLASEFFTGLDIDLYVFPILEGYVSLSEAELNSLSYVYPNPAKNEVMLASSFSIERVEIVNMLGQVVYSSDVNANSIKVNTSDFATGNYVVKMFTENGMATKKLVVE